MRCFCFKKEREIPTKKPQPGGRVRDTREGGTWVKYEEPISLDENFDVILSTLDRILNKLLLYVHFNICNIPVID